MTDSSGALISIITYRTNRACAEHHEGGCAMKSTIHGTADKSQTSAKESTPEFKRLKRLNNRQYYSVKKNIYLSARVAPICEAPIKRPQIHTCCITRYRPYEISDDVISLTTEGGVHTVAGFIRNSPARTVP